MNTNKSHWLVNKRINSTIVLLGFDQVVTLKEFEYWKIESPWYMHYWLQILGKYEMTKIHIIFCAIIGLRKSVSFAIKTQHY